MENKILLGSLQD
jgi:hypothetical protein